MRKQGIIALVFILFLTGCGSGISQEDYNAVIAERDEAIAELSTVKEELAAAQADITEIKTTYTPPKKRLELEKEKAAAVINTEYKSQILIYKLMAKILNKDPGSLADEYRVSCDNVIATINEAQDVNAVDILLDKWLAGVDDMYKLYETKALESPAIAGAPTESADYSNPYAATDTKPATKETKSTTKETKQAEETQPQPDPEPQPEPEPEQQPVPDPEPEPELVQEVTTIPAEGGQALKKAKSYLDISGFSYSGLIEQLKYSGFPEDACVYAADNCGADWYEQAVRKAKSYLEISSFSKVKLIEQLEYTGFTSDQATYGAEQALQ